MAQAIAYLRVSTDRQAEEGVSLDAQRDKVERYAALEDMELAEVIVEGGASGKTLERPGLSRALAMLASGGADALIVYKLDRLTRSVRDLGVLLEGHFAPGKASLHSVVEKLDTGTAGGRMVLNIMTTVAQWEREVIVERTKAALDHKRAQGQRTGSVPYGSRLAADGRTLEPDPAERAVIARARELRASGLGLRPIALRLAQDGLRSRSGGPWAAMQVSRMLAERPAAG